MQFPQLTLFATVSRVFRPAPKDMAFQCRQYQAVQGTFPFVGLTNDRRLQSLNSFFASLFPMPMRARASSGHNSRLCVPLPSASSCSEPPGYSSVPLDQDFCTTHSRALYTFPIGPVTSFPHRRAQHDLTSHPARLRYKSSV